MYIQTIDLDLVPGKHPPIIHVCQYDRGDRSFTINLYHNGQAAQIPNGTSAVVTCRKDGRDYRIECTLHNTVTGSVPSVTGDIERTVTDQAGRFPCHVVLSRNDDALIRSGRFYLDVMDTEGG